jgi:hypothetical protein
MEREAREIASWGGDTFPLGKHLAQYSLQTVQMFHDDARAAGFKLI